MYLDVSFFTITTKKVDELLQALNPLMHKWIMGNKASPERVFHTGVLGDYLINLYCMDGMQIGMQILSRFPVFIFISLTYSG